MNIRGLLLSPEGRSLLYDGRARVSVSWHRKIYGGRFIYIDILAEICLYILLFLSCRTGRDWTRDVAWEFGMGDLNDLRKMCDRGITVGCLKQQWARV